ncbi:MAG: S8 family serine peptidase [Thiocapsa sp. C3-sup]|uniref:S8 family serine peptidase n=2 Tax=Thiocapsa TaxID=1056 RepID=UPI0035B28F49
MGALPASLLAGFLIAGTSAPALAASSDVAVDPTSTEVSALIVRLERYDGSARDLGISPAQLARMTQAAGLRLSRVRAMSGDARVLSLPARLPLERAQAIVDRIKVLPGVAYAVPDRIMFPQLFTASPTVQLAPDDPLYEDQWHYFSPIGGINLPAAWDLTVGDPDIHVAVLDTGIRGEHEDLVGQWSGGYDFINSRFNARDRNGRDADPTDPGDYSFFQSSSWHGTHVAGTIGAATDNATGVAGIAFGATIQPVRTLGRLGGITSDILDAMRWSAGLSVPGVPDNSNPAKVLNMSLGGSGACDAAWQSAVDDVVGEGSVLVVAAGNSSSDEANFTPASCDDLITVAATDPTGDLARYSNFGPGIEISAPGGDVQMPGGGILSTLDSGTKAPTGDTYGAYNGTSMATPHVAGVVALMFSVNPSLTPGEVLAALQSSARPFPNGTDCGDDPDLCGAGILDAYAAVQSVITR